MAAKPIDVEDLVVWACPELARKPPPGRPPPPRIDASGDDRSCLGKWDRPMGFPPMSPMFAAGLARAGAARGDPPHPDALVIETEIRALRLATEPRDAAAVGFEIGFAVDIDGALRAALGNVANLILVSGRLGKRPALPAEFESAPRLAGNGKPGVFRREIWNEPTWNDHAEASREVETPVTAIRARVYPAGSYCGLEWAPDPQSAINDRAEYWAWIRGLGELVSALEGKLESRIALAPRAARAPWAGDIEGSPIPDLFRPGEAYAGEEADSLAAERRQGRRRPIVGGARVYAARAARPAKGVGSAS